MALYATTTDHIALGNTRVKYRITVEKDSSNSKYVVITAKTTDSAQSLAYKSIIWSPTTIDDTGSYTPGQRSIAYRFYGAATIYYALQITYKTASGTKTKTSSYVKAVSAVDSNATGPTTAGWISVDHANKSVKLRVRAPYTGYTIKLIVKNSTKSNTYTIRKATTDPTVPEDPTEPVDTVGTDAPRVKIDGVWKPVTAIYIKVNGTWSGHKVKDIYTKVNNQWRQINAR